MSTITLIRIQAFLVALASFVKIFRLSVGHRGFDNLASSLGSLIIYVTIFISIILIASTNCFNQYVKIVSRILLFYVILFFLQKVLTPETTLINSHITDFVLLGIGSFTVGYSLFDVELYIKYVGSLSIIVGLLFIFEPINSAIMHQNNMTTGYTLVPICIYGLLYSLYTSNNYIKILAFLPCVTVALFTSRGCGLSIICFYLLSLIWKYKLSLKKSILLIAVMWIGLREMFLYVLKMGIDVSSGSMMGKFLEGELYSDNGREYLLELGWSLVLKHPFTGLGLDGEIAILDKLIMDYPFIHNVIVELFLDFGVPVATILLLLYFVPIIKSIINQKESSISLLLVAMICAVWIRLFFSDSYSNNIYSIMMLFGIAYPYTKKIND